MAKESFGHGKGGPNIANMNRSSLTETLSLLATAAFVLFLVSTLPA